ncbi:START-like domain protein [Cordyceps fumosorosea ARSEF 2679]|uniref:START-like domain protein n=1 Tax=Cordyceps fumosorosea (strain ARSEF 2679) TaxID=1081104 RepID=A0A168EQF3_CORFA|nr:START-like domain protein [Cordyceps fumosorosea ARSEF 2679]OAA74098.1 START-like domain protein [Cordyceps fumosorosea ARSEF 2679]
MVNAHEPLQALAPVDWTDLPQDDLAAYINELFSQAMIVVESIPSPSSAAAPAPSGRARAKTESAVLLNDVQRSRTLRQPPASLEAAVALRKDWKEIKVNPRDNPLGINVFKMSSKDGKGAWFARQSVHEGLSFDEWRVGLEREFAESLKVQGSPGVGNIRGIGADRHVEDRDIDGAGHLSVFQLSAQFPGPTSPRDFITLLLTSDLSHKAEDGARGLRQYVIVSKPCNHSECPPRQGIIRGQYESVEIIREVHVEPSVAKRSMSAVDLAANDEHGTNSDIKMGNSERLHDARPVAVEWLMVTRSDPGGSVPRFLIEKGTPPGIVGDAGKFLKWVTAGSRRGWDESTTTTTEKQRSTENADQQDVPAVPANTKATMAKELTRSDSMSQSNEGDDGSVPSSNGIYGIITGIFGVASSVVANGLGLSYASSEETISTIPAINVPEEEDGDLESDTSSVRSFLSALEKRLTDEPGAKRDGSPSEDSRSTTATNTTNLAPSRAATIGPAGEKELRKLQERRRKIDDKMVQMQSRLQSKSQGDRAKDEASLAKLREKLDREAARQEDKYRRELQKLEERRESEARKAERRRRKAADKEEKSSLALELERARAERDLAWQHNRILEGQVRELQAQNTQLVARLGRMGGMSSSTLPLGSTTEIVAEKQT